MSTTSKSSGNAPGTKPDQPISESREDPSPQPRAGGQPASGPAKKGGQRLWLWAVVPLLLIIVGLILDHLKGD